MRRLTRRSFVTGGAAALAGLGAWRWLTTTTPEDGLPWPLRRVLRLNEALAESIGSPHGLAQTFPADRVQRRARTNGLIGLEDEVGGLGWELRVEHASGSGRTIRLEGERGLSGLGLVA